MCEDSSLGEEKPVAGRYYRVWGVHLCGDSCVGVHVCVVRCFVGIILCVYTFVWVSFNMEVPFCVGYPFVWVPFNMGVPFFVGYPFVCVSFCVGYPFL